MSEWEYERACRGPIANVAYQTNELVWGLDGSVAGNRTPSTGLTNSGANNEIMTPNPCVSTGSFVANNATGGPLRVGNTHATCVPVITRTQAGSSFYGVADMAGNVQDWVFTIGNNGSYGNSVVGTFLSRDDNGDGNVTNALPTSWSANTQNLYMGGCWATPATSWQYFCISFRTTYSASDAYVGGRGARTAQ